MGLEPTGNEGRRVKKKRGGGSSKGLCKTAPRQTLIRCSCWRSMSPRERECVRRRGRARAQVDCARELNENSWRSGPTFSKQLGVHQHLSSNHLHPLTFLGEGRGGKKIKRSCVFGTVVFLLRVVLASVVFFQPSTRVEMVYVLPVSPRGRLFMPVPAAHDNNNNKNEEKHSSIVGFGVLGTAEAAGICLATATL